jgi:hypothetical protein
MVSALLTGLGSALLGQIPRPLAIAPAGLPDTDRLTMLGLPSHHRPIAFVVKGSNLVYGAAVHQLSPDGLVECQWHSGPCPPPMASARRRPPST